MSDSELKFSVEGLDDFQPVSFSIERDLNRPDYCALTYNSVDPHIENLVTIGGKVKVTQGDDNVLFVGEVVGIDVQYGAPHGGGTGEKSNAIVRAFDPSHRLLRGTRSATYQEMGLADVAKEIVGRYSLEIDCEDPGVQYVHLDQHNESDLDLLRRLADRVGYFVWFGATKPGGNWKLNIGPLKWSEPSAVLEMNSTIETFQARLSTTGIATHYSVNSRSREPNDKFDAYEFKGSDYVELERGNRTVVSGPEVVKEAFGEVAVAEVRLPGLSSDEADLLAQARMRKRALKYITGSVSCSEGRADLSLASYVDIDVDEPDMHNRFDGHYLVTGISHRGNGRELKSTQLRIARDAHTKANSKGQKGSQ